MNAYGAGPAEAQTVEVRVQVIDVDAHALDLVLPTYLAAKDLTQRIARDGNLGAYWPDGKRRQFWLRARGRLMQDHEKLSDLGVMSGELLHLLPQPPEGSEVIERPPEYPETRGYAAAGYLNIAMGLAVIGSWWVLWAVALTVSQNVVLGLLPPTALAVMCTTFARHVWGGPGSSFKIPATGMVLYLPLWLLVGFPAFFLSGADPVGMALVLVPSLVCGILGVTMSWLAWYGAVEPLPKVTRAQAQQAAGPATVPCGICGLGVDLNDHELRADCGYGCGKIFHSGCLAAKESVHMGDGCAVCGYQPA